MRLLNAKTQQLQDFFLSNIPKYAILSHTWGDGEVTLQDVSSHDKALKKGFAKITETCRLAREHGLEFAWIDTCCIDKSSSAELTESINSMFQYYQNAQVCFVFLEDLLPGVSTKDGLPDCRWFKRGWTLQELLAPERVEFFDSAWRYRGSKVDFVDIISASTRIPKEALLGQEAIWNYSVAMRMSWAAPRSTTRLEDIGYCLLGIFNVNMSPIYGEGLSAFRRLQEEIIKHNNDLSILAWDIPHSNQRLFLNLFAPSPAAFIDTSDISPFRSDFLNFSITNKGLLITGDVRSRLARVTVKGEKSDREIMRYLLYIGRSSLDPKKDVGIHLRKVGPRFFYRDGRFSLVGVGKNEVKRHAIFDHTDYYILTDPVSADITSSFVFRDHAVHVPFNETFKLVRTVPEKLWDFTDRVFLRPRPFGWTRYPMVLAMAFDGILSDEEISLVVLCDYRSAIPACKVFKSEQYSHYAAMILRGSYVHESIYWEDLQLRAPELLLLDSCVEVTVEDRVYNISVSFDKGIVESVSVNAQLFSLKIDIV